MTTYNVTGYEQVEHTFRRYGGTPQEAVREYFMSHKHVPETVEWAGREVAVIGICEGCEMGILEGDKYGSDIDHCTYACEPCAIELAKEPCFICGEPIGGGGCHCYDDEAEGSPADE